jgi:hypothetical protein
MTNQDDDQVILTIGQVLDWQARLKEIAPIIHMLTVERDQLQRKLKAAEILAEISRDQADQ